MSEKGKTILRLLLGICFILLAIFAAFLSKHHLHSDPTLALLLSVSGLQNLIFGIILYQENISDLELILEMEKQKKREKRIK